MKLLPGSIQAVNREARDHGMTYGHWVALHYNGKGQNKPPLKEAKIEKQLLPEEIACRKAFGARLKQARKNRWLSQAQLAQQIGTNKRVICKWELGLSQPTKRNLQKLRQFFGEEAGL